MVRKHKFRNSGQEYVGVPLMAANMDTVGTFEVAQALNKVSMKLRHCNCSQKFLSIFQHKAFTCIHKHYTVDEWKQFAKEQSDIFDVSNLDVIEENE